VREMARRITALHAQSDLIVVSDYCHGAVCDAIVDLVARLQRVRRKAVVIDGKQISRYAASGATLVTPNIQEAGRAVGLEGTPDGAPLVGHAATIAYRLRARLDAENIAITMADHGVLLTGPTGEQSHYPCPQVDRAADVGAGDTFTAASAMALASGGSPAQAVRIGIDAASIALARSRTATVSAQDLLRRASLDDALTFPSRQELFDRIHTERLQGKRIVFTNGVFDILHAGHVDLLRRARALGDVLVVGVNSDASTRRLKGPKRPVNRESDRLALVSALDSVDCAVLFEEDTPAELIRAVRPHIHVKGGDYQEGTLPEIDAVRDVGARVEILSLIEGRSTTALIDRILSGAASDQVGQAG
jgi:D-beta-D-heptose 7-phosphate kinase/D-beta-D-heptose 1-phosphate adenosyltransferase